MNVPEARQKAEGKRQEDEGIRGGKV